MMWDLAEPVLPAEYEAKLRKWHAVDSAHKRASGIQVVMKDSLPSSSNSTSIDFLALKQAV